MYIFALANFEPLAHDWPFLKPGFSSSFPFPLVKLLLASKLQQRRAFSQFLCLSAGLIGPVDLWLLPFLPPLRGFVFLLITLTLMSYMTT